MKNTYFYMFWSSGFMKSSEKWMNSFHSLSLSLSVEGKVILEGLYKIKWSTSIKHQNIWCQFLVAANNSNHSYAPLQNSCFALCLAFLLHFFYYGHEWLLRAWQGGQAAMGYNMTWRFPAEFYHLHSSNLSSPTCARLRMTCHLACGLPAILTDGL